MENSETIRKALEGIEYVLYEIGQACNLAYCDHLPQQFSQDESVPQSEQGREFYSAEDLGLPTDPIIALKDNIQIVQSYIQSLNENYDRLLNKYEREMLDTYPLKEYPRLISQLKELSERCSVFIQYIETNQEHTFKELEKHFDLIFASKERLEDTIAFTRDHGPDILDETISYKRSNLTLYDRPQ